MSLVESSLKKALGILRDNVAVEMTCFRDSDRIKIGRHTQHLAQLKHSDESVMSYLKLFINNAIKCEIACPTSGQFFIKKLCGISPPDQPDISSYGDVKQLVSSVFQRKKIIDILLFVLDTASVDTKITLKKGKNESLVVNYVDKTYKFHGESLTMHKAVFETQSCRVAAIDGYVERASEIHHLLEELSSSKVACVLFCRGAADDVLHTISLNRNRGTLNLFPYKIPFDIENANVLVDISVTSGAKLISTLTGDLISSISLDKTGEANDCVISGGEFKFTNSKTENDVKMHLHRLTEKLSSNTLDHDALVKRIASLSGNSIEIYVPDDIDFVLNTAELDLGLRIIRSIVTNSFYPEKTAQSCLDSLREASLLSCLQTPQSF